MCITANRRISEHGKEEEEAEEKIPLTERNSSKIKAAQITVRDYALKR
jgi:hypothetical protein